MLHLLSKNFFQNRPNCGKMKQDNSETISQAYSQLLQAYCVKKTQCHNPISSFPVIGYSNFHLSPTPGPKCRTIFKPPTLLEVP